MKSVITMVKGYKKGANQLIFILVKLMSGSEQCKYE